MSKIIVVIRNKDFKYYIIQLFDFKKVFTFFNRQQSKYDDLQNKKIHQKGDIDL